MTTRRAAAIYARISQDRDGNQLGIQRQLEDCRAEASRVGWTVAEEYVDDDISAYSGTRRPAYQRMLDDIQDGLRDAILVWHIDRLHRRPLELEQLHRICQQSGVTDLHTVHGAFDLGTGDGMLLARLLAAVAANESDSKRRRGRRKAQQIAESGAPHMGGLRPFGFLDDRVTHHPEEAPIIRQLTSRVLAGESLPSLGRWLIDNEVRTVTGKMWKTQVIRGMLLRPRNYAIRELRGQPIGPAAWEPIISAEQGEALRRLLNDPGSVQESQRPPLPLVRDVPLPQVRHHDGLGPLQHDVVATYVAPASTATDAARPPSRPSPSRRSLPRWSSQRLDSPELHDALAGRARDDDQPQGTCDQIEEDNTKLEELAEPWRQLETITARSG